MLNDEGGIVDDLMITRPPGADGALRLVVNASRKAVDFALIRDRLPPGVRLTLLNEAALIALQGPTAALTLARLARGDGLETMPFMSARPARVAGFETFVSRSGYTGEDGYEVSLLSTQAESLARILLAEPDVAPDRARRPRFAEARGRPLPLWPRARRNGRSDRGGAFLVDSEAPARRRRISRRRAHSGRSGQGPARLRVGIRPDGRAPAREGVEIVSPDGAPIGVVTSGGFGPSVGAPIAMGFVERAYAAVGTPVRLMVRGKPMSARVVALPFYPHAYHRGQARNG